MAEIKNTFIKSKMNKDLDDRLVPTGEYRDALNIQISRSEGQDVGAIETVLGNELYYGEDSYETCIGHFADQNNKNTYYFVTDYIDTSANGISNFAPILAYCAIIQYNHVTNFKTVLVEGQFLNFSARSPITGVNVVEDLLFWTDNRNQPRKININNASASPAAPSITQRVPSQIPTPYYTKEDQISVAKYYPWRCMSLMNTNDVAIGATPTESTMTNPAQEKYPNSQLKPDYDINWPGDPDYLSDKFIRLSYRFKFDDNEYSLMAPFTQPCFIPKQYGYFIGSDFEETYRSTVVSFFENNVTQIIANIEFETLLPSVDLKIKEVEILYKESDGLQVKVIESIPINNIQAGMVYNGNHGGNPYVYSYKYISKKPYKNLTEDQTTRVYDQVPTRALAQEISGNRVIYGNFYNVQSPPNSLDYSVSYGDKLAILDTNYKEYPNHTLKQNRNYQVGFVLADRFGRQSSVILSSNDNAVSNLGSYFGGSTIYVPYKNATGNALEWPGYALKTLINEIIPISSGVQGYPGLYKDESYGADLTVINAQGTGYTNGTYNASTSGGSGNGLAVQARVNAQGVRDVIIINSGTGYTDGDLVNVIGGNNDAILRLQVSKPNLLGWYTYKIVVKQTEQDYYNVYLPGILDGYPDSYINSVGANDVTFEQGKTANIVLFNDNINKVPRDLKEVGPDQKQYRSSVRLFGRVSPTNALGQQATQSAQYYPSSVSDNVVSISTLADTNYNGTTQGNITQGDDLATPAASTFSVSKYSLEYPEFYQSNTNPLIARISIQPPASLPDLGRKNTPTYSIALGVYETEAVESLLDIYWETASTGKISDLNTAVIEGGFEGAIGFFTNPQFVLKESDAPGANCFAPEGTGFVNPFDGVQVINGLGNLMYSDCVFELVSMRDYNNDDRSNEFELITGGGSMLNDPISFNMRTASLANFNDNDAYFFYGQDANVRTFKLNVRVIYTNPTTSVVTTTTLLLENLRLENVLPLLIDGPSVQGSALQNNYYAPSTYNQDPIEMVSPGGLTLISNIETFPNDFDGNIYWNNGSHPDGDKAKDELYITHALGDYSPDPNKFLVLYGPNDHEPNYPYTQLAAGQAQLYLKALADPTVDQNIPDKCGIRAFDAGTGNAQAPMAYIEMIILPRQEINVTLPTNGVPVCLPYGFWNESSNSPGTTRIPVEFSQMNNGQSLTVTVTLDENITQGVGTISIPAPLCFPPQIPLFPLLHIFEGTYVPQTFYLDLSWNNISNSQTIAFNIRVTDTDLGNELFNQLFTVSFLSGTSVVAQQLYQGPNNGQCGNGIDQPTCSLYIP